MTSVLLNSEWVKNDIKLKIKKFLDTDENELTTVPNLWDRVKAVLKEVHSYTGLTKRYRNISNKQPNPDADPGPRDLCVVAAMDKFTQITEILWRKRDGMATF